MRVGRIERASGAFFRVLATALATCALSGSALAQTAATQLAPPGNGDGMDSHLFRPVVDAQGFLHTNGTAVLPANSFSFGFVLDVGQNVVRTNPDRADPGAEALIEDSFQGTFNVNFGLFNRAVIGLQLPLVLTSTDESVNDVGPTGATYSIEQVDADKVTSLLLHGKVRLTPVDSWPGVALLAQVGLPVADAARDLGTEPKYTFWPRVAAEQRFIQDKARIGLDLGYRMNGGEPTRFGLDADGLPQLAEGELVSGDLATIGLGLSFRALPALDVIAETYASYLMSDADPAQRLSQELLGGIKLFTDGRSYLLLGAGSRAHSTGYEAADVRMVLGFSYEPSIADRDGDGILDNKDGCPEDAEDRDQFEDEDGCPDPDNDGDGVPDVRDRCRGVAEDHDGDRDSDGCPDASLKDRDRDGILDAFDECPRVAEDKDDFEDDDGCPEKDNDDDGIPDQVDRCPSSAEDKDGFEDEDGCPDRDDDNDQIPDAQDECPREPETYNGRDDFDGCPDDGRVIIEGSQIIILDKVQFATGSAQILAASDPILDAVAATLKGHPGFLVVEIAGHADVRGSDELNLRLTRSRAESVAKALAGRGIEGSRLVSQGYGEYCPLDPAETEAAYEKNRRVDFKVVKTKAEGLTDVERGCPAARTKGISPPEVR